MTESKQNTFCFILQVLMYDIFGIEQGNTKRVARMPVPWHCILVFSNISRQSWVPVELESRVTELWELRNQIKFSAFLVITSALPSAGIQVDMSCGKHLVCIWVQG